MHSHFPYDLKKARKEKLFISIGQRMTSGPLLRLSGYAQISDATSNPVLLNKYDEVEVEGRRGAPSTFILATTLIDHPQFFMGYHLCGLPLFLGIKRATEGHVLFLGPTRSGKTTGMAGMIRAAIRHGYPSPKRPNRS